LGQETWNGIGLESRVPKSRVKNADSPMIIMNLDVMLAKRKMRSNELAERIGLTQANLSILKTGKAKAIRLTTLDAICRELQCTPGDILEYREDAIPQAPAE